MTSGKGEGTYFDAGNLNVTRTGRNLESLSRRQRVLSLSAAAGLNCAGLLMLLLLRTETATPEGSAQGSSVMVSLAAIPQSQEIPAVVKAIFAQNAVPADSPADVSAAASSSASGAGASCPVLEDVAKGIMADPAALDAIIQAPPETRSIADAIVIWNTAWAPATESSTAEIIAPLEPVRTNVQATLQAVPDECLSPLVTGPRLIAIPNGDRSTILVFGSGDWSWRALAEPSAGDGELEPADWVSWLIPGA